jgi:hypothetical protein
MKAWDEFMKVLPMDSIPQSLAAYLAYLTIERSNSSETIDRSPVAEITAQR